MNTIVEDGLIQACVPRWIHTMESNSGIIYFTSILQVRITNQGQLKQELIESIFQ